MALGLELAKYVNGYTKDIVSGYLRKIQSSLPYKENPFYIVPDLIQSIILIFYYGEYFNLYGDKIQVNEDHPRLITYEDVSEMWSPSRAYGNIDVFGETEKIYIWTFKFMAVNTEWGDIHIGINDNSSKTSKLSSFIDVSDTDQGYYGLKSSHCPFPSSLIVPLSGIACDEDSICASSMESSMDENFRTMDEIRMELDTREKTLVYYINDSKCRVWFENIKFDAGTIYNMMVCFGNGKYTLSVIDFQIKDSK